MSKFIVGEFFKSNAARKLPEWMTDDWIIDLVVNNWEKRKKGYRNGVYLVPVPPQGFLSPVIRLEPNMVLMGSFKARTKNEEPRKKLLVPNIELQPAEYVDIVVYSKETLQETHDGIPPVDFDYEIITVLAQLDENQPMQPETLCYNHFKLSGGTSTKMTDTEFVAALKESFIYWKDKAMIG